MHATFRIGNQNSDQRLSLHYCLLWSRYPSYLAFPSCEPGGLALRYIQECALYHVHMGLQTSGWA